MRLGKAIHQGLLDEYACDWFQNSEDGEAALKEVDYDLIVLDINLPGMSGLEFLSSLRAKNHMIPVLLLTARDAPPQRVEGLDTGADDYLIKPFDFEELLARLRALLRRKGKYQSRVLQYRDIELDMSAKTVKKAGALQNLSSKEFDILYLLIDNAGRCLSKQQIEDKIYDFEHEFESNTVEVYVSSIRRKLGKEIIKTMRGVGYIVAQAS